LIPEEKMKSGKEAGIIEKARGENIEKIVEFLREALSNTPDLLPDILKKAQSIMHSRKACEALGVDYVEMTQEDGLRVDYYAYLAIVSGKDPLKQVILTYG
jgi:hypothetical protein